MTSNIEMFNDMVGQVRKAYPTCTNFRIAMKHSDSKNWLDTDIISVYFDAMYRVSSVKWQLREERPSEDCETEYDIPPMQRYIRENTHYFEPSSQSLENIGNPQLDRFISIVRQRAYPEVSVEVQKLDSNFNKVWINLQFPLDKDNNQDIFNDFDRKNTEYGRNNLPFIRNFLNVM